LGIWAGVGYAVFDEDAVDAEGVEPVADLSPLYVESEDFVRPAGEDKDGGAGVVSFGGIEGKGGVGDVGEADVVASGDKVANGGVGFWSGMGGFTGSAVRPKVERGEVGRGVPEG
jgi:hypothetical protein